MTTGHRCLSCRASTTTRTSDCSRLTPGRQRSGADVAETTTHASSPRPPRSWPSPTGSKATQTPRTTCRAWPPPWTASPASQRWKPRSTTPKPTTPISPQPTTHQRQRPTGRRRLRLPVPARTHRPDHRHRPPATNQPGAHLAPCQGEFAYAHNGTSGAPERSQCYNCRVESSDDRGWHCCFCFEHVDDYGPGVLRLTISKPGLEGRQQWNAHEACFKRTLNPKAGFEPDIYSAPDA